MSVCVCLCICVHPFVRAGVAGYRQFVGQPPAPDVTLLCLAQTATITGPLPLSSPLLFSTLLYSTLFFSTLLFSFYSLLYFTLSLKSRLD